MRLFENLLNSKLNEMLDVIIANITYNQIYCINNNIIIQMEILSQTQTCVSKISNIPNHGFDTVFGYSPPNIDSEGLIVA